MTTTLDPSVARPVLTHDSTRARATWPVWGIAAGVLGTVATVISEGLSGATEADRASGAAVIETLNREAYHLGVVAGFFAVAATLFTAAGWRRWASRHAPDNLAARVVAYAFTASAGAMILGYGMKGSLAVYLDGGMDEGSYPQAALHSVYMFLDFAPFAAWWGTCIAAGCIAFLALRERLLPKWIGVVSVVFTVVPVLLLATTGLPGFPGVIDPIWLAVISAGLVFTKRKERVA
jgi:hypothetical protein